MNLSSFFDERAKRNGSIITADTKAKKHSY